MTPPSSEELMLKNAPHILYLTVSAEGVVSLWDTLEATNAARTEALVLLMLTPAQMYELERGQRVAAESAAMREARRGVQA